MLDNGVCRLYIKQPPSRTSIAGDEEEEPEWLEYKIKETNMFTVDKYQQVDAQRLEFFVCKVMAL